MRLKANAYRMHTYVGRVDAISGVLAQTIYVIVMMMQEVFEFARCLANSRRTRKQPVASRLTSTTYTLDIQAVAMDVVLARSSRSNKVSPIKLLSRSLPPLLQRKIYCQDNSCLCNNNFWTAMVDHALQKYTHTHTHTHHAATCTEGLNCPRFPWCET